MKTELNESWLHGFYTVQNCKVEINTKLPYLSIEGACLQYFTQDENAWKDIQEIHSIWVKNDCTIEDAINQFINTYF